MKCTFASQARSIKAPQRNEPKTITPPETTSRSNTPASSSSTRPAPVQVEPYVNATHVELFYCAIDGSEWAFGYDVKGETRPRVLKHAFAYPFLLNELLAVSALHLSTCRPARQSSYREESTRLQSQAMRLFNESIQDLNAQNIIAAFLFSGLLGIATFFETFHDPRYKANDLAFFEKIVQSVTLLRGVRAIVDGWWEFLLESEIKDILDEGMSPNLERSDEVVDRFEAFRVRILQSPGLDPTHAAVYDEAIETLVWVYKAAFSNGPESTFHDQAAAKHATRWMILLPPGYTELLIQRKPEALVILGHFAIILHKLRACWTVGDAARQLLLIVEAYLEEAWHAALSWPKSFVDGD